MAYHGCTLLRRHRFFLSCGLERLAGRDNASKGKQAKPGINQTDVAVRRSPAPHGHGKRWQKCWLIAGCVGFYYFALVERGIRDRPGPKPVNQPEPASQQQQQQQQQQGRESSIFCPISKKIFDIYSVVNPFTLASIYYIYIYIASRVDPAFVVRLQGNRDYSLNYTIRLCNNYAAAL